jgi:hypothetical protein
MQFLIRQSIQRIKQSYRNDVVQHLVNFELVFPPSFFNIMMHPLVHLIKEISILGPMFLHNMFSF